MALSLYSVLDILLSTIMIMIQGCSQALKICKCLWSLSCGCVSNMLLVLSIAFHCHYCSGSAGASVVAHGVALPL